MAGIPGGDYTMNGKPVTVSGYCLDLTEVTVDAYAKCVEAKACTEPKLHGSQRGAWEQFCNWKTPGRGSHPVNGIDWSQAQAYCAYDHKRLPSEEEWEWAARNGGDGSTYPWGDEAPSSQHLNACGGECPPHGEVKGFSGWRAMYPEDDGWPETSPVGSYPRGANRWGVLDLAGNVWEWTSGTEGASRVYRGGGWFTYFPSIVRATYRFPELPSVRSCLVGVRCASTP
jgi:formylglycine-generating enzyme required for sulfatase activity